MKFSFYFLIIWSIGVKFISPIFKSENKTNAIIEGKFLAYRTFDEISLAVLTDKKFTVIEVFPFSTVNQHNIKINPLDSSKFFILSTNHYCECTFDKELKCFITNIQLNSITQEIILTSQEVNLNSLVFSPFSGKDFLLSWAENERISLKIFNEKFEEISSFSFDSPNSPHDKEFYLDYFPETNQIILSYSERKNSVIKIFNHKGKSLFEFRNLIDLGDTAYVKTISNDTFIMCTKKPHNKNFCRVTKISEPEKHNKFQIKTYHNIYNIIPFNEDEFIIAYKRNDKEVQAVIYDLNGNKKSEVNRFPITSANYANVFFSAKNNALVFLYGFDKSIFAKFEYINISCQKVLVNIDLKNENCTLLNFDPYIKASQGKREIMLISKPSKGKFLVQEKEAKINFNYQLNDIRFCYYGVKENEFPIIAYYRGILDEQEDTNSCQIIIKPKTKAAVRTVYEENEESSYQIYQKSKSSKELNKYVVILTYGTMILIALVSLGKIFEEKNMKDVDIAKYYIKYFTRTNVSAYKDFNELLWYMIKRYGVLSNLLAPVFNPFYLKYIRLIYPTNIIMIILFFSFRLSSSISPQENIIVTIIKITIFVPALSMISLFFLTLATNRLLFKPYTLVDYSSIEKRDLKKIFKYYSNNDNVNYIKIESIEKTDKIYKSNFSANPMSNMFVIGIFLVFYMIIYSFFDKSLCNSYFFYNVIMQIFVHFLLGEICYALIYTFTLNNYCFDIHLEEKNTKFKKFYYWLVPPHIEVDYYALELFTKFVNENIY